MYQPVPTEHEHSSTLTYIAQLARSSLVERAPHYVAHVMWWSVTLHYFNTQLSTLLVLPDHVTHRWRDRIDQLRDRGGLENWVVATQFHTADRP